MTSKTIRRLIIVVGAGVIGTWIAILIKRSIPYSDSGKIYSAQISIDSIWSLGPTVSIYDKRSEKYYWMKAYTSFDHPFIDSLKSRNANVRYMKFFQGPLENRIVRMEVDSVVILDQIVEQVK